MAMARASRRRRPRRAPRWLLLGLVLTLVTLVVSVVSSASSDGPARRYDEQSYLDRVRPLVERSTEHGGELVRTRSQALRIGREGVQRQLGRAVQDAQAVLGEAQRLNPPESLSLPRSILVTTLVMRVRAVAAAREGFEQAYATGPPGPAAESLARASEEAAAADRTYEVFVASLPPTEGGRPALMPASKWVTDVRLWDRAELSVFVGAVRASASPTPVHELSVLAVTTRPPAVGTEGPASVLPVVRFFQLEVVVANMGNAVERDIPVVGTLEGTGGSRETVQATVDLEPGQRRSLTLAGLRPVLPGAATLRVAVGPVAGEANLADNERTQLVVLRAS